MGGYLSVLMACDDGKQAWKRRFCLIHEDKKDSLKFRYFNKHPFSGIEREDLMNELEYRDEDQEEGDVGFDAGEVEIDLAQVISKVTKNDGSEKIELPTEHLRGVANQTWEHEFGFYFKTAEGLTLYAKHARLCADNREYWIQALEEAIDIAKRHKIGI